MTLSYTELLRLKKDQNLMKKIMEYTNPILGDDPDIPFRQRYWHYENNVSGVPKCIHCDEKSVTWFESQKSYRRYCSSRCAKNDEPVKLKTKQTCLEKYGEETNLRSEQTKQKIRQTNLTRYGVEHVFKSEQVKEKIKQTNLTKYGETRASKTTAVKAKIDDSHYSRYNRKRHSQSHIDSDIIDTKNNRELMLHWYKNLKMPITEIAERLNVNHAQLTHHFKKNLNIDISRHSTSVAERSLRDFILKYETNLVFNDRTLLKPKEIDILVPEKKVAIEVHGLAWHVEHMGKHSHYHYDKYKMCSNNGYQLLQITDLEYREKPNIVHSRILSVLGHNDKIHARSCEVRLVGVAETKSFLNETHIQGYCISPIRLGLYVDDRLVACMTFGRPRFNKHYEYELLRYSTLPFINVVGGPSKLFTYFVRHYNPKSIISYCDLRYGVGKMYEALGFKFERETGPNYWICKQGKTFENRVKFQKHKLHAILEVFDPSLTEYENLLRNNYDRFWDCGNKVFVWNRQK